MRSTRSMLTRYGWLIVLYLTVGFAQTAICQQPKVDRSKNPFSEESSIRAKTSLIDQSSPGLSWDNMVVGFGGADTTQHVYREYFARSQKLSAESTASVNGAFKVRQEAHDRNHKQLRMYEVRELNIARGKQGLRASPATAATDAPAPMAIEDMLKTYEAEELLAEVELIAKLEKLLTAEQFEALVAFWVTPDNLYIPIVAKYLQLSEEQVVAIKAICMERRKFGFELVELYPGDLNRRNKACLESPQWHELNYRALAFMNHAQFKKVASKLLTSWKSQPSFTAKLEELSSGDSLQSQTELRILGNLYRLGAELERNATPGAPDLKLYVSIQQGLDGFIYQAASTEAQREHMSKVGHVPAAHFQVVESRKGQKHMLSYEFGAAKIRITMDGSKLDDWWYMYQGRKSVQCEIMDVDGDGYLDCRRLGTVDSQIRVGRKFMDLINKRNLPTSFAMALEGGEGYSFTAGDWRRVKGDANEASLDSATANKIELKSVEANHQITPIESESLKPCSQDKGIDYCEYPIHQEPQDGRTRFRWMSQLGHQVSLHFDSSFRVTMWSVDDVLRQKLSFDLEGNLQSSALTVGNYRYDDTDGDGVMDSVWKKTNDAWQAYDDLHQP